MKTGKTERVNVDPIKSPVPQREPAPQKAPAKPEREKVPA